MTGLTDFFEDRRLSGEDGRTAFRVVRFGRAGMLAPTPDALAADLVAFANGYGGWVFFGAAGGGSFGGLPADRIAEIERRVAEVAAARCRPPIHPEFHRLPLPARRSGEGRVVLVRIPRGLFLHRIRGGGWYCRSGSVSRRLTRRELHRARLARTLDRQFDGRAVGWATQEALADDLLRPEIARGPGVPAREVLRCSGITRPDRDDPEVTRPTVAGLVALGRNPADFLPAARIEASVFAGTAGASAEPVHAESLTGPLAAQVDAAIAFVSRFDAPAGAASDRESAAPEGGAGGRESTVAPAYSPEVVFEAVANAVAPATTRSQTTRSACPCSPTGWKSLPPADFPACSPRRTSRAGLTPATVTWRTSSGGSGAGSSTAPSSAPAARASRASWRAAARPMPSATAGSY